MDALTPAIGFTRTNGNQTILNNQRNLIEAWAVRTGHAIAAWAGSLDEALDLVKTGPARTVVATDLDRFSRNSTVVLDWLDKLKRAGGHAETLDGPVGPDSMETVLRLAAGLDEFERSEKPLRVAIYHRVAREPAPEGNPKQQAAEVDGTRPDDEPPRP